MKEPISEILLPLGVCVSEALEKWFLCRGTFLKPALRDRLVRYKQEMIHYVIKRTRSDTGEFS